MSSIVKAKCPKCKTEVSVEEDASVLSTVCTSCQTAFVPATVIAESNKRFEMGMYVVMLLVGLGLIVYMAATGSLKPKPDPPAAVLPE
ncbi:hypothetical protein Poly51_21030 [Rubripirellula tenax]|uniref:Uncharacterized protein n=1 Tax=Rubripirellula tenax TaxID=2528015 RepID=A0A5C6FD08_9BACT|nr:hypothetical protein [Rubripirellula tenax]TWU59315.1 hypothetical protein Poly51_21030 [Rubripirellula tenax]